MSDSGEYVCAACGKVVEPPTPTGAIVPYVLTGGILGKEQLYACSDPCFAQVVERVQRMIGEQLHG